MVIRRKTPTFATGTNLNPTMAQEKYDVFISYSRKDYVDENKNVIPGNVVSIIKDRLTAEGISYWMDEKGIYSGDEFALKIAGYIRRSPIFLFISTKNSNASEWTSNEIAVARQYKKKIIPFRVDDSPYNESIIIFIAALDFIEYPKNPELGLTKLITAIKAYLNQLEQEEKRKQEEEELKREAERKKKEDEEKLRLQLEAEQKRKEEEARILKEQEGIATDIEVECDELNAAETKLALDRNTLISKTKKIKNQERRETLKAWIENSSPSQQKYASKMKSLQDQITALQSDLDVCVQERDAMKEENKERASKIGFLEETLREEIENKNTYIKKLHIEIEKLKCGIKDLRNEREDLKRQLEEYKAKLTTTPQVRPSAPHVITPNYYIGVLEHTCPVNSAFFSPDGTKIVSTDWNETIRIWDAITGKQIGQPLQGNSISASFCPDGKRIVSGCGEIWDATTGKLIGHLSGGYTSFIKSIPFSPDGKQIVLASNDASIRIWDLDTGLQIGQPLMGHTGMVKSASFSPDGTKIISISDDNTTISYDNTIRIWDVTTGKQIGKPLERYNTHLAFFSPKGNNIVTAQSANIKILDATTGIQIGKDMEVRDHNIRFFAFSPDGTKIISPSHAVTTIRIWDIATQEMVGNTLKGHTRTIYSASFSPDGRRIVSASDDETIRIWDVSYLYD